MIECSRDVIASQSLVCWDSLKNCVRQILFEGEVASPEAEPHARNHLIALSDFYFH